MNIGEQINNVSHFLYTNKKYREAGDLLSCCIELAPKDQPGIIKELIDNAKMCYFLSTDIEKAYQFLLKLEELKYEIGWEHTRDKIQFMRLLGRYNDFLRMISDLPERSEKYLFHGWYLHKTGKFREAFEVTEKARNGVYWWNNTPPGLPVWDGIDTNKTLLVCGESGYGDEIIFARWIPELKKHCGKVVYHPHKIFIDDVICRVFNIEKYNGQQCDYLVPCMSLPYLLKSNDPEPLTYLTSNKSLKKVGNKIRIGINNTGDITHPEIHMRIIPLKMLVDSLKDLGELVNIQKDVIEANENITYPKIETWEDTLAIIDSCDLIVTACTSLSHAAGALGKKVIALNNMSDYFTWCSVDQVGKSDWYENAWCIRQTECGRWDNIVEQARELAIKLLEDR